MSRADDLRAEYDAAIQVAELEDRVTALKAEQPRCKTCGRSEGTKSDDLRAAQDELRALRYVLRLGRQDDDESARALAALRKLAKEA